MTKHIVLMVAAVSLLGLTCVLSVADARAQQVDGPPAYAWIEGEKPATKNYDLGLAGWGQPEYLSGGAWGNIGENEAQQVPDEGLRLSYEFEVPESGSYEVWGRLGYDYLWYPFHWRIDDGDWTTTRNDNTPTLGHVEMMRWNTLVWTRMGHADLTPGKHTLHIRLDKPEPNADGPRFLWAADAFCIYKGDFRPNGQHPPGADWQTERDEEAAAQVFELPEAGADGRRTKLSLEGLWQIARFDDPDAVENRLGPVESPPAADQLYWSAIEVPGNRNTLRPELTHCHRYLYRTRVFVPESHDGRSFHIEFPALSMVGTVFVNGRRCGWTKDPWALWRCDVTDAIRPGEVNELWVGIKDTVYAISPDLAREEDFSLRSMFKVPMEDLRQNQGVTFMFDMPVALWTATGLVDRPLLVSAGRAYTEDAFVIPSVEEKSLGLELTLRNPSDEDVDVEMRNEVEPWQGGPVEKSFRPVTATIPARGEKQINIEEDWADPALWWPDRPQLYNVVTTLRVDGRPVDVKKTRFGFREWDWSGTKLRLNGVPWPSLADHTPARGATPEEGLRALRENNVNTVRLTDGMGARWAGLNTREAVDFFDEHGILVRRGTIFNGMFASYQLALRREVDGQRVKVPNRALFDNTNEAILAWVRGYRNNPSVFIWSLENEITYINARNLGNLDVVEPEIQRISDNVMSLDPTRPTMVDGGRALQNQSLPVNGCHYEEVHVRHYPDEAYVFERSRRTSRRTPWPMAMDKPIFLGESYYSGGKNPQWYATIGGEICFAGIAECEHARGLFAKMLAEGYRWFGIAGLDMLIGPNIHNNSFSPVAVFCREWNWTFGSGARVPRTLKVFNDTRRDEPITVAWSLRFDEAEVDGGQRTFALQPGAAREFDIELAMPAADERIEGELLLTCTRDGQEVFREVKDVSLLDADAAPVPDVAEGEIALIDPAGTAARRLRARGIPFARIDGVNEVPASVRLVVVGADAVDEEDAGSTAWRELAAGGRRVLLLDQEHPLRHGAVPADAEVTDYVGRIGFMEESTHEVFDGLKQKDFFCWSGDHVMYRNVYVKPSRSARSLLQCDDGLSCTALLECPVEEGLMLLCQAAVGTKLDADPVAQRLFDNTVNYALDYELVVNPTAAAVPADGRKRELLDRIGLAYDLVDDPLSAVTSGWHRVVVVDATPRNLGRLASDPAAVREFTRSGGWLMLWGVTPEGLEDFNTLVGVEHIMRPFRQERVTLRLPADRLASGLSQRDVAMTTGRKYNRFMETEIPADDAFSYVVDYNDIAPFAEWPSPEYFKHFDEDPLNNGHHPLNMLNGMTSRDYWKFIFYLHLFDDPPTEWTIELPRRERVTGLSIVPNASYHHLRELSLRFDGRQEDAVTIELAPYGGEGPPERQDFDFEPRAAREVTFELEDWDPTGNQDVVGIDNLWLRVDRPEEFYRRVKPLLNVGALVRYPQGEGGIVLNQVNLPETEVNPVNAEKKGAILRAVLGNLHSPFGSRAMVRPSEGLSFRPVNIGHLCNLYLDSDEGWPIAERDLSALPLGRQRLDGIAYHIRDFETSPLPSAVAVGEYGLFRGPESVGGIPVGRRADALFFLHTLLARQDGEEADRAPEAFRYVVHYADGQETAVSVRPGVQVADWLQPKPPELPKARVAWSAPAEAPEGPSAVIYHMQWVNPRPDVPIESIDVALGPEGERAGLPVVLGITTAQSGD
ncbi:MAG: glycoside hydrolase family 2 TIM barrel-domain containing protein [Candidatus Brocadiia bacterium]